MTLFAVLLMASQAAAPCPVVWTGGNSKVESPEVRLVETETDWHSVWSAHTGEAHWPPTRPVPEIDFRSHNVLVIFGGKLPQTSGYTALALAKRGDTMVFRYEPRVYGVATRPNTPPDAFQNTPYGFFLLPKTLRSLRVEEGIRRNKVDPPTEFKLVKELKTL